MPPSKGQGPGQIKIQFTFIVRLDVVLKPASLPPSVDEITGAGLERGCVVGAS